MANLLIIVDMGSRAISSNNTNAGVFVGFYGDMATLGTTTADVDRSGLGHPENMGWKIVALFASRSRCVCGNGDVERTKD